MANLKDIRQRISSVKNTQQITRAMKMVSAAKLRRAQENIQHMRPYAQSILSVIADVAATHRISHPLLSQSSESKRILLVVINSDRGLCGAFNNSVNRYVENWHNKSKGKYDQLDYIFIGKRVADYFKREDLNAVDVMLNLAKDISYVKAAQVAEKLMKAYTGGQYDEIRFIYNEFKSAISQNLVTETLLPVDVSQSTFAEAEHQFATDLIFEPQPEAIIDELLHKHFAVQVYRCMSESVAAEHAARMTAMENATNNAKDMISKLTLTYNKLRQAAITTELIEITSGAEAL